MKKRPDFLNRAALDVVIQEFINGKNKSEALDILSAFIGMRKIPVKADFIFQEVKKNNQMSDEDRWILVKASLDQYNNLPVNVFVEQVTSDLASKGMKDAINAVSYWVRNPTYAQSQIISSNVDNNIAKLLNSPASYKEGLKVLKEYLKDESFIKKTDTFNTYDLARLVAKILTEDTEEGVNILKEIYEVNDLSINQQIVISSSINSLQDDNKELLKVVFQKFVRQVLLELTKKNQLENKFFHRHSRESLVQFAEKLAKNYLYEEALWMVNLFIDDSDPPKNGFNNDDDKDGTFNYHNEILRGGDPLTINTVRGYCAWVLQKFAILHGRDYIPRIIPLVQKLAKDPNYYVREQSLIPLIDLARNRNTVLPDNNKERFLSKEVAQEIEHIVFGMLFSEENQQLPAIMKHLGMVVSHIRTLDEQQAYKVLNIFLQSKLPKKERAKRSQMITPRKSSLTWDEVVEEIISLFIFYAEFRKDAFKNEGLKEIFGEEEWIRLNSYNDKPIKDLLTVTLEKGSEAIKAQFAWHFWKMAKEDANKFNENFELSLQYLRKLSEKYQHDIYDDIYYFIEDNFESKPEECIGLWMSCIDKEKDFFDEHFKLETQFDTNWWPYHKNGSMLVRILKIKGRDEFLKWLKKLLSYPAEVYIANDLNLVVDELVKFPKGDKKVKDAFDRLIKRNASYFDSMKKWEA